MLKTTPEVVNMEMMHFRIFDIQYKLYFTDIRITAIVYCFTVVSINFVVLYFILLYFVIMYYIILSCIMLQDFYNILDNMDSILWFPPNVSLPDVGGTHPPPKNLPIVFRCVHTEYDLQSYLCIPSRELTYPTLGKGKSSSKWHFFGNMLVPWRVRQHLLYSCKKGIDTRKTTKIKRR